MVIMTIGGEYMKKNKLFLLLIMALLVIIPGSVKAFNVSVGGDCHVGTGVTPSGTAEQPLRPQCLR